MLDLHDSYVTDETDRAAPALQLSVVALSTKGHRPYHYGPVTPPVTFLGRLSLKYGLDRMCP